MANEEHLKALNKALDDWNKWKAEHVIPEVTRAEAWEAWILDMHGKDFAGAHLDGQDLTATDFTDANLSRTYLRVANLSGADLTRADLSRADLIDANLSGADLSGANLSGAYLGYVNLSEAILNGANLSRAHLADAILSTVDIKGADLTECTMDRTIIADVDLSDVKGLETIKHEGPSQISVSTIYRSQGKIPEIFLRGAGIPEPFIPNMKALVSAMEAIQFYSCFISYSSKDQEFATRLYSDLQDRGVRCWFAPEDLRIGDKLRPSFDEAIRSHDKLMVVLSTSSVMSTWVEKEVETAFEKERQQNRTVLFPIRLDDAVMGTEQAWAADIRRTRYIGDFRDWKTDDSYKKALGRLMRDLKGKAE